MADDTIQKVVGVALAIFVVAVVLPPAFRTLADSAGGERLIVENTQPQMDPYGSGHITVGVAVDNEDFPDNAIIHEVDIVPTENVDNYGYKINGDFQTSSGFSTIYETVAFMENNDEVHFENTITIDETYENAENILLSMNITSVQAGGENIAYTVANIEDHFDLVVRAVGVYDNGFTGVVQTLLLVLLPILSIVAIIRLIYGNI